MGDEVTAAVIVIGNEILSGRTQDVNLQYLARGLTEVGVRLKEARVVPDEPAAIIATVNQLRAAYTYVFTTGGIGPTHDDITSECVAKAFGVRCRQDPRAVERLLRQIRPEDLNEARLRMATIPEGAELIDNPISHAPGFHIGNVYVMAGIPRIMQAMFDGIRHNLKGGARMLSKSITIFTKEGTIAGGLAALAEARPGLEIGSYPFSRDGQFGAVIVVRGTDPVEVAEAVAEAEELGKNLGARTEVDD